MNRKFAQLLQLDAIEKSYGEVHVLRGFSAAFAPGEVTALVGRNGSGKTTLLRIVAGLQRADSGTVIGGRMATLSRGELHQVGLDVAFALGADALLLDEPWTALEPDAREALNDAIRSYAESSVVLCSSHDLDEVARVADAVVFLSGGKPTWVRRDELGEGFQRDELIRVYREGGRR